MNHLRQLCVGMMLYTDENKGLLPVDGGNGQTANPVGYLSASVSLSWDDPGLWFNAIPPMLSMPTYYELIALNRVPGAGANSVFVCPAADWGVATVQDQPAGVSTQNGYFMLHGAAPGGAGHGDVVLPTYLCYAINSKLNEPGNPVQKLCQMRPAAAVAAFVEKRMTNLELPPGDPNFGKALGQLKAEEKRFTTRHRGGGFIGFFDGHVAWFANKDLNTPTTYTPLDYNDISRVIWNPFGVEN